MGQITDAKWRTSKEIVQDGLYLQAVHGKSESISIYVKNNRRAWYISYDGKSFNFKLNRRNNKSLFFGPITNITKRKYPI